MFSLHDFTLKTIKGYIGKVEDSQVREMALVQFDKGRLKEYDLEAIDELIEAKNAASEEVDVDAIEEGE